MTEEETSTSSLSPSQPLSIIWRSSAPTAVYEAARVGRIFNLRRPERYPQAIVFASEVAHILVAIQLAHDHSLTVAIRSGGHSWAAWSLLDNSILLDLGGMKHLALDEETLIASVSPSTTGEMLQKFLEPKSLWFPGGHCPDVALGGFLLVGGMGWNCKNWGWACEKLVAFDAVTANGEMIHCDSKENNDLFWAARGAGPGFPAILTRLFIQVQPVYSNWRVSTYVWPKSEARQVINWILKIAPTFDRDTEITLLANYCSEISDMSITAVFLTFKSSEQEARQALQAAEEGKPPHHITAWFCQPTDQDEQYNIQRSLGPENYMYRVDNVWLPSDIDVASIIEPAFITTTPNQQSFIMLYSLNCRNLVDMPHSLQEPNYVSVYAIWNQKSEETACNDWLNGILEAVKLNSSGSYIADFDFEARKTTIRDKQKEQRLMQLRRKWDPDSKLSVYHNWEEPIDTIESKKMGGIARLSPVKSII